MLLILVVFSVFRPWTAIIIFMVLFLVAPSVFVRNEYHAMDYVRDTGCYHNGAHPPVPEGANRIWSAR